MNRRNFIIGSATGLMGIASGALILAKGFSPPEIVDKLPELILPEQDNEGMQTWLYHKLDTEKTTDVAYQIYPKGSCMYGVFAGIINQLAEQYGEPYQSFPVAMMKYGSSGIGNYGSLCGALNGAAAALGLFVGNKLHRNALIEEIFSWYEQSPFPVYQPVESKEKTVTSVSNSVLCHVSTGNWMKASGYRIDSQERKERCRRLTADVAGKTVGILNRYFAGNYEVSRKIDDDTQTCVQCHSKAGKLGNVRGKMSCTPCHDSSLAHEIFADVHYKWMPEAK